MNNSSNTNKLVVPGAKQAIERMKYEIANEFGVNLGPDATSRANGSVGGEITNSGIWVLDSTSRQVFIHLLLDGF